MNNEEYFLRHLQSDIEKARLEFYKIHPEAVIRTIPPRSIAICYRCFGEISIDNQCLHNQTIHNPSIYAPDPKLGDPHKCPNCKAPGHEHKVSYNILHKSAIPHAIVRITEHVLKEKESFWKGTRIISSIKEYAITHLVHIPD